MTSLNYVNSLLELLGYHGMAIQNAKLALGMIFAYESSEGICLSCLLSFKFEDLCCYLGWYELNIFSS